jgi:hypothetical protein
MEPLLHPQDSEVEAELIRAGRDINLSPVAQARLLAALGVAAGVTAAGEAAAASVGVLGKLLASKGLIAAVSVISVGAIGAGVYFSSSAEVPIERAPSVRAAEPVPTAAPLSQAAPERAASATESERTPSAAPSGVDSAGGKSARTSTRKASVEAPAGLGEELALLETVSRATKAGNGALALQHSTEYKRRFPRGKLALEAQVLHIEALALAGYRAEASRLAQGFLKRHPDSPVAARIRRFAH